MLIRSSRKPRLVIGGRSTVNVLIGPEKQALLFGNTARAIADAPKEIKIRHIGNCLKADPNYGKGVAKAIGIPLSEITKKK